MEAAALSLFALPHCASSGGGGWCQVSGPLNLCYGCCLWQRPPWTPPPSPQKKSSSERRRQRHRRRPLHLTAAPACRAQSMSPAGRTGGRRLRHQRRRRHRSIFASKAPCAFNFLCWVVWERAGGHRGSWLGGELMIYDGDAPDDCRRARTQRGASCPACWIGAADAYMLLYALCADEQFARVLSRWRHPLPMAQRTTDAAALRFLVCNCHQILINENPVLTYRVLTWWSSQYFKHHLRFIF